MGDIEKFLFLTVMFWVRNSGGQSPRVCVCCASHCTRLSRTRYSLQPHSRHARAGCCMQIKRLNGFFRSRAVLKLWGSGDNNNNTKRAIRISTECSSERQGGVYVVYTPLQWALSGEERSWSIGKLSDSAGFRTFGAASALLTGATESTSQR